MYIGIKPIEPIIINLDYGIKCINGKVHHIILNDDSNVKMNNLDEQEFKLLYETDRIIYIGVHHEDGTEATYKTDKLYGIEFKKKDYESKGDEDKMWCKQPTFQKLPRPGEDKKRTMTVSINIEGKEDIEQVKNDLKDIESTLDRVIEKIDMTKALTSLSLDADKIVCPNVYVNGVIEEINKRNRYKNIR